MFWESKNFLGPNGPVVRYFFHPCFVGDHKSYFGVKISNFVFVKSRGEGGFFPFDVCERVANKPKYYTNVRQVYAYAWHSLNHISQKMLALIFTTIDLTHNDVI